MLMMWSLSYYKYNTKWVVTHVVQPYIFFQSWYNPILKECHDPAPPYSSWGKCTFLRSAFYCDITQRSVQERRSYVHRGGSQKLCPFLINCNSLPHLKKWARMCSLKAVFEPFVSFLQILIFNGRALSNAICVYDTPFWLSGYVSLVYIHSVT